MLQYLGMKKNKLLVVGNWKMNPGTAEKAKEIFRGIKIGAKELKNIKVVICPPFVYLSDLEKLNASSPLHDLVLGAQDMFWEKTGAFTGEISSEMLKGEGYVILGHSERRDLGETDEMVAKKLSSAIKGGLKPILCIGEKTRDDHGEYLHFLRNQIINSLGKLSKGQLAKLIIAYEPVWAIGKEEAMKPTDIHEMTIFIKKVLVEIYGQKVKINVPVLYGGAVSHDNASNIIKEGEVQGLLVGRASLNPKKFGELIKNVNSI
jgi:triosephosphate isomerase (TIM)